MKKFIFTFLTVIIFYTAAFSQSRVDSLYLFTNSLKAQKTNSSKDILTNVFRASIANILGKSKSFQFNSTLYGIDSLVNKNDRSAKDKFYAHQKLLRSVQLNFSVKADSSTNELKDFSGGLTIAVINKRDITYADFRNKLVPLINSFEELRKKVNTAVVTNHPDADFDTIQRSWSVYDTSHNYKDLNPLIRAEVEKLNNVDQQLVKVDNLDEAFKVLVNEYAHKPLLTISPGYNYNRISKQSSATLSAAYVVGLTHSLDKKPWELEAKSSISIGADTTIASANYNSRPFLISMGVNKILRETDGKVSTLELKNFFQYDHQFGNLPSGSEANKYTFNSTLRIRLYNSVWLPLTLSYDVKNANILGFLSLTANIDK